MTEDEGGGYYDSGYIQPTSFFGDGTRVPMIAVSPWVSPGHIDHTYPDHVSVLKFIEANWRLRPLSSTSLDNLPNPIARHSNPYVPTNGPAIGNLMSLFDFNRSAARHQRRTGRADAPSRAPHDAALRAGEGDRTRSGRPGLSS